MKFNNKTGNIRFLKNKRQTDINKSPIPSKSELSMIHNASSYGDDFKTQDEEEGEDDVKMSDCGTDRGNKSKKRTLATDKIHQSNACDGGKGNVLQQNIEMTTHIKLNEYYEDNSAMIDSKPGEAVPFMGNIEEEDATKS